MTLCNMEIWAVDRAVRFKQINPRNPTVIQQPKSQSVS